MTLDRHDETPQEDAEHGVLSDAGSLDSAGIGILGTGTAQLRVSVPLGSEDDLDDDDVLGDEIRIDEIPTGDIILEELPAAAPTQFSEVHGAEELHAEAHDEGSDETRTDPEGADEASAPLDEEVADSVPDVDERGAVNADAVIVDDADAADTDPAEDRVEVVDDAVVDVADAPDSPSEVAGAGDPETSNEAGPSDAAGADSGEAPEDGLNRTVDVTTDPQPAAPEPAAPQSAAPEPANPEPANPEAEAPAPVVDEPVAAPVVAAAVVSVAPVAPVTGTVPTTRREAAQTGAHQRIEREHASERVTTHEPELVLASKRLGEFDGSRESADLLTPDRLLDPAQVSRPEPEGLWQQLVYSLSGHRINLGDSPKARARKALDRQIAAPLSGGARFVPVLSRKGGVGKTTITALLGMALADARDDRVIAVDANPDRGTLADRISRTSSHTVRDLVRTRADVVGYSDISAIVARDETRLDVLSSDADPRVSEAFNDRDYRDVAVLAAHYYSLVLTDTGTGIVHSVMGATLDLADQLVIVAGLSVDEARLASETLTWLETNGYAKRAREAIVVINNARPGAPLVRESELEAHFRTRVRAVIRVPYDTAIGTGSAIVFRDLQQATRKAARELAAAVVSGLRSAPEAA